MAQPTISWTEPMLKRFKTAQKAAAAKKKTEFVFDGNIFDVRYAKYLTDYLDVLFKAKS